MRIVLDKTPAVKFISEDSEEMCHTSRHSAEDARYVCTGVDGLVIFVLPQIGENVCQVAVFLYCTVHRKFHSVQGSHSILLLVPLNQATSLCSPRLESKGSNCNKLSMPHFLDMGKDISSARRDESVGVVLILFVHCSRFQRYLLYQILFSSFFLS